jgi:metal-dependent amidase/aminoacylase/carboxypeptidase family protein
MMSAIEASAIQVLGGQNIVVIDRPSMGGEDFAVYIDHVRGAQFRLGCAGSEGDWPLLHSPIFDVDESRFHRAQECWRDQLCFWR